MYQIRKQFLILFVLIFIQISVVVSFAQTQSGKLAIDKSDPLQSDTTEAMALYYNQDYKNAEVAFKQITDMFPGYATAFVYLADSQMYLGKKDQAYRNYNKAYMLLIDKLENRKRTAPDLKNPEIYSDIIYCLNALGKYEEAKKVGLWGTIEGETPDVFINLGYTVHKLGRDDIAVRNYCKYSKLTDPREVNNLYHQRINTLFEPDDGWYVECPDDKKQTLGTNYALIIGVGNYKDPSINSLRYVENDVRELYDVLTNPRTGIFKPENIMTLINEDATEKNVKFKFDDMVTRAKEKDDLVLVFYAGHGFSYPNGKDTFWLTYDTIVGDETGNRIKSTAFSNLTLSSKISDIKAGKFVFFIDACFSAGMVEKQASVRGLDSYLGIGKDYTIVTSSKADQLSIESPKFQHGLFTYALINGLSGKADVNKDGWVEIDELWPYMKSDISIRAQQMGSAQNPVRSGSSGGSLRISKNPNY